MDAYDIFKKLTRGAKFTKQQFRDFDKEMRYFKQQSEDTNSIKLDFKIEKKKNIEEKIKEEPMDDEFVLLDGIKTNKNIKKNKNVKINDNLEVTKEQERINHIRKINRINVSGKNVPKPLENFDQLCEDYNVSPKIVDNLKNNGFTTPTPIQMQAMPIMLSGKQILACAPTGSGKTAAFLVPIIHNLKRPDRNGFRALIICPTRELARQIFRECNTLSEGTGIKAHLVSKTTQKTKVLGANFTKKFDILITTPNRLIYMTRKENPIDLKTVQWLIIDESDKLFEVGVRGFRQQLADIYKKCDNNNLKRGLFSATHTYHVAKWCRKKLKGLISVTVGHRNTATDIVEQKLTYVGNEHGKLVEFRNLKQKGLPVPVLVFVQSKERAINLFEELIYDGILVDVIHADRTQLQRDNVVRAFREGKLWVLICTELMGRGIDFKGVNLVINYDFPQTAISYIHRIGRTGRAGRPGKAITFFTEEDKPALRSIAIVMRDSGCEVPEYMLSIKKPSKKLKQKLVNSVPRREDISVKPSKFLNKHRKSNKNQNKQTN